MPGITLKLELSWHRCSGAVPTREIVRKLGTGTNRTEQRWGGLRHPMLSTVVQLKCSLRWYNSF